MFKRIIPRILALSLLMAIAMPMQAQDKLTKKQKDSVTVAIINGLIESRQLIINATRINSYHQQFHELDPGYGIVMQEDSIKAHLPLIASGISGAYGSDSELTFDAEVTDFNVKSNKKGDMKTLTIKAHDNTCNYSIKIVIFKSAQCNISVSGQGISTANYEGVLRLR